MITLSRIFRWLFMHHCLWCDNLMRYVSMWDEWQDDSYYVCDKCTLTERSR